MSKAVELLEELNESATFNKIKKEINALKSGDEDGFEELSNLIGQSGPDGRDKISSKEEAELMKLLNKKS